MVDDGFSVYYDGIPDMLKSLDDLKAKEVLVGIPQEKSSRPDEGIGSAELLYIHTHGVRKHSMRNEMDKSMASGMEYSQAYDLYIMEHGSPLWRSPPRPVLEPSIKANANEIAEQLAKATTAAIDGDLKAANEYLERAGMVAQNAARDWFTNSENGWPPNSPKTVNRKKSDNPLIDTGELRKAISYVIREKGVATND